MRMVKRMFVAGLAVLAIALFISSLVLPFAVASGPFGVAVVSFWDDLRLVSAFAAAGFAALAITPILRPTGKTWVLPLVGSLIVIALASLMLADHLSREDSGWVLLTICVFAVAGAALLAESFMARYSAYRAR